jgi:hypothetical protein
MNVLITVVFVLLYDAAALRLCGAFPCTPGSFASAPP